MKEYKVLKERFLLVAILLLTVMLVFVNIIGTKTAETSELLNDMLEFEKDQRNAFGQLSLEIQEAHVKTLKDLLETRIAEHSLYDVNGYVLQRIIIPEIDALQTTAKRSAMLVLTRDSNHDQNEVYYYSYAFEEYQYLEVYFDIFRNKKLCEDVGSGVINNNNRTFGDAQRIYYTLFPVYCSGDNFVASVVVLYYEPIMYDNFINTLSRDLIARTYENINILVYGSGLFLVICTILFGYILFIILKFQELLKGCYLNRKEPDSD